MLLKRAKQRPPFKSVHSACHEPISILGNESAPIACDGKLNKDAGELC
jgi:hypothetical protein